MANSKWTEYHNGWYMYIAVSLQLVLKLPVRTRSLLRISKSKITSQVEDLGSDTKKILSRPASQNTLKRRRDMSRRRRISAEAEEDDGGLRLSPEKRSAVGDTRGARRRGEGGRGSCCCDCRGSLLWLGAPRGGRGHQLGQWGKGAGRSRGLAHGRGRWAKCARISAIGCWW